MLFEHPLLAPVDPAQVQAEHERQRGGLVDRVARGLSRLWYGRAIVDMVDTDYATHAALARQARQPELAVRPEFAAVTPELATIVTDAAAHHLDGLIR